MVLFVQLRADENKNWCAGRGYATTVTEPKHRARVGPGREVGEDSHAKNREGRKRHEKRKTQRPSRKTLTVRGCMVWYCVGREV